MNRTQQLRTINGAFADIPELQDGWKSVSEHLLEMNLTQERRHRHGERNPRGFSAVLAAKYFVVHHLLDGLAEPDRFTVDDILTIRNEVLYAQAYAKRWAPSLAAWQAKWAEPMKQVDYAFLMAEAS